jgi:hypothetical protein
LPDNATSVNVAVVMLADIPVERSRAQDGPLGVGLRL